MRRKCRVPPVAVFAALLFIPGCGPGAVYVDDLEGLTIASGAVSQQMGDISADAILGAISARRDIFREIQEGTKLTAGRIAPSGEKTVHKLEQTYNGLPVFGHGVVAHTEGSRLIYVVDHIARFSGVPLTPALTAEQASGIILSVPGRKNSRVISNGLGYSVRGTETRLVYRMKVAGNPRGAGGVFEVDAFTGSIRQVEPEMIPATTSVTLSDGTTANVEIAKLGDEYTGDLCDGPYCTVDATRAKNKEFGVQYFRSHYEIESSGGYGRPTNTKIFASASASDWSGAAPDGLKTRRADGVSALWSMAKIYDWYGNTFNWKGISNRDTGLDIFLVRAGGDPLGLNAFWVGDDQSMVFYVAQPDDTGTKSASFAMSPDVVGHEFTHGVQMVALSKGGLCQLEYNNDWQYQGVSVSEGFCDTMGNLATDDEDPDWKMGERGMVDWNTGKHYWLRNDGNPYDPEATTWGDMIYKPVSGTDPCGERSCYYYPAPPGHDKKDCPTKWSMYGASYVCLTLVAYPAWKTRNKLGVGDTSRIYFNILDKYMPQKVKLVEVPQFAFDSCNDLFPNTPAKCCEVYRAQRESAFPVNTRGMDCSAYEPPDGGTGDGGTTDGGKDGAVVTDGGLGDAGKDGGAMPDGGGKDGGLKDGGAKDGAFADSGEDASDDDGGYPAAPQDGGAADAETAADSGAGMASTSSITGGCSCSSVGVDG